MFFAVFMREVDHSSVFLNSRNPDFFMHGVTCLKAYITEGTPQRRLYAKSLFDSSAYCLQYGVNASHLHNSDNEKSFTQGSTLILFLIHKSLQR